MILPALLFDVTVTSFERLSYIYHINIELT